MQRILFPLFILSLFYASSVFAENECNADTAFFYLPQNEFNTGRAWYGTPNDEQDPWEGGLNYYDMYDPLCCQKQYGYHFRN